MGESPRESSIGEPSSCDAIPGDFGELGDDLAATALAMARRFSRNATLWCASPHTPAHAHHVAVEFVHPVIVGKRALPAAVVDGPDWSNRLGTLARSGDIALFVAQRDDADVAYVLQRDRAWGLLTVWIGTGPRPPSGAADFVLWLNEDAPLAALSGRIVLLYHLLWELTHVCFEHPGLLTEPEACTDEVCVTCSDEGRLGEVVSVLSADSVTARTADGIETIDASLVEVPHPGALILIHAGSAVAVIEPAR
jgi:hypothetical protein